MGDKTILSTKSKKIFLTHQGLDELRSELEFLKNEKRAEISKRLQEAREMDDMNENSEYDAAIVEQEVTENRIMELERILREAKVIKTSGSVDGSVVLGSTVLVQFKDSLDEFTIVGKMEANPIKKKISDESPIGLALMGAKKGDSIEVSTPMTTYTAKVVEIK